MEAALQTTPMVGALITSREEVPPQTRLDAVVEHFARSSQTEALAVVEERRPLALATRGKIQAILLNRFALELYGRDPIIEVADRSPLMVHAEERIDLVLDRAMKRAFSDIYDEIMVVDDAECFLGCLSVKRLVLEQGSALATSLAQREVALGRAREMEKISEIKSQFLAHVTHELRSPVNAIIGLAELMQMTVERGRPEQLGQKLPVLLSSAVHLRGIITNILDLSKIEAGRMEVIREDFELSALVREIAETTRILVRGKQIEVAVVVSPDMLDLRWRSDAVKVRQILLNLAGNAAKFTERGMIELRLRRTTEGVAVEVRDTGIGIRQGDLERLFAPFTQLEDAATKRHEGTGLGLAITHELTRLLEGRIEVESRFGEGSVFTLHLPLIR